MPSAVESICCQEVEALSWRLHGLTCATEHESVEPVCLDYEVLVAAMDVNVAPGSITEPLTPRLEFKSRALVICQFNVLAV
jgi:hypothetical protein